MRTLPTRRHAPILFDARCITRWVRHCARSDVRGSPVATSLFHRVSRLFCDSISRLAVCCQCDVDDVHGPGHRPTRRRHTPSPRMSMPLALHLRSNVHYNLPSNVPDHHTTFTLFYRMLQHSSTPATSTPATLSDSRSKLGGFEGLRLEA